MSSLAELKAITERVQQSTSPVRVLVGLATCGIAAGAQPVYDTIKAELAKTPLSNVELKQTGCIGVCQFEPVMEIYDGDKRYTYVKMDAEKAKEVFDKHLVGGTPVPEYTIGGELAMSLPETAFYKAQTRVALRNCGIIDPENVEEYIARDGYQALYKVLTESSPDGVIDTMLTSGLRGRGGAGFPTGLKWKFASANRGQVQKYVCCNADEGDPGAFMDRAVLEGDPHVVLEAMAIAGFAIGSNQGYIYVRAEYPIAVKRLHIAIDQAHKLGLLGKNIFGTGFDFDIDIRLGSGAFVCGEETALMTSIEGKRGEPRPRPPFPAVKGLFASPTILNNVETWANIPTIIRNGAEWFAAMGTKADKATGNKGSTGTKVFALGGKINHTGLVEVEMGTPLRTIIEQVGGGIPNGKAFKAAQTGGPSGGCIPASKIDVKIDYENLIAIGSMMGSGGLIVMDEDNCMVDIAKFFLDFTVDESCGKCTPCRIGTRRLLEILDKITSGKGEMSDLDKLEELANYIKANALCGLGQTAPNPVLSTLRYFRDEYVAHIEEKRCPAHVCKKLLQFHIVAEKCRGCTLCARNCPANAITGTVRQPHVIDQAKCIKCGACMDSCKFGAIIKK